MKEPRIDSDSSQLNSSSDLAYQMSHSNAPFPSRAACEMVALSRAHGCFVPSTWLLCREHMMQFFPQRHSFQMRLGVTGAMGLG